MNKSIADMASMVNEILTFVRGSAQEMEIGEVEQHLLSLVVAVGRVALEEFVAVKGSGYAGKEITDGQGTDVRMSVREAVSIGQSSERFVSKEPIITQPAHRESFL